MVYDVHLTSAPFKVEIKVKQVVADSSERAQDLAMGIIQTALLPRNEGHIESTIHTSLCTASIVFSNLKLGCKLECRHLGLHESEYKKDKVLWTEMPITTESCSA